MSLCSIGFEITNKRTLKREFFDTMVVDSWTELVELIDPLSANVKNRSISICDFGHNEYSLHVSVGCLSELAM